MIGTGNKTEERPAASLTATTEISGHVPDRIIPPSENRYYGYAPPGDERPLREYVAVLFQYKIAIICCALIGFVISGLEQRKIRPSYSATALVNIGTYSPPVDGAVADMLRLETQKAEYISNQIPLLSSYVIANEVLSQHKDICDYIDPSGETARLAQANNADGDAFTGKGLDEMLSDPSRQIPLERDLPSLPVRTLESYLGLLKSDQMDGTTLVSITATVGDAEMAAKIANAQAHGFIELVRRHLMFSAIANINFLRRRVQDTKAVLEEKERAFTEFARKHAMNLSLSDATGSPEQDRFRGLFDGLSNATMERVTTEGSVRELRRNPDPMSVPIEGDRQGLFLKLSELQSNHNVLKRQHPNHPALRSIKEEIKVINEVFRAGAKSALNDAEIKFKAALERERIIKDELEDLKKQQAADASTRMELAILERQYQAAKAAYDAEAKKLEQATVTAKGDQNTVILVDPAMAPTGSLTVNKKAGALTGLVTGLLIGIGVAFLLNFFNNAITTAAEVRYLLKTDVIGVIPSFTRAVRTSSPKVPREKRRNARNTREIRSAILNGSLDLDSITLDDLETDCAPVNSSTEFSESVDSNTFLAPNAVAVTSPLSRESESFRSIRATLRYSGKLDIPQIILVTSAQKGDGKTTVAVNLAASIASTSARTILIDADLRLPTVHRYFHRDRTTPGLCEYLLGAPDVHSYIQPCAIPSLSLLFAGTGTTSPAEILDTKRMQELLEQLSTEYEQIIIDTPPVVHVTDALLLTRMVDGVVMVVRSGKTMKPVAELAVGRLQQVKANMLGVVLNDVKKETTFRSAEYYVISDYYNYGQKA